MNLRGKECMVDMKEFPFLVELLDDDSEWVRERVISELENMGPYLDQAIDSIKDTLSEDKKTWLERFSQNRRLVNFQSDWMNWQKMDHDGEGIYYALQRLAYLEDGSSKEELDELACALLNRFKAQFSSYGPKDLIHFLHQMEGFYSSVAASFASKPTHLSYVLKNKSGAPVLLVGILMKLSYELGLPLSGVFWRNTLWPAIIGNKKAHLYNYSGKKLVGSFTIIPKDHSINKSEIYRSKNCVKRASVADLVKLSIQCTIETHCRRANPEKALLYAKLYEEFNVKMRMK